MVVMNLFDNRQRIIRQAKVDTVDITAQLFHGGGADYRADQKRRAAGRVSRVSRCAPASGA